MMNGRTETGLSKLTEARRTGRDPGSGACTPDGARGVRLLPARLRSHRRGADADLQQTGLGLAAGLHQHLWRDAVDGRRPPGAPAPQVGAPALGAVTSGEAGEPAAKKLAAMQSIT